MNPEEDNMSFIETKKPALGLLALFFSLLQGESEQIMSQNVGIQTAVSI